MSGDLLPFQGAVPSRRLSWPTWSAVGWLVCVGLVVRLIHYLCNHTIWYDEAVLLANVLGKDWARLLGPLDYEVAAPPIFLWGLRLIAVAFGDNAYIWRFPPFLVSCATLLVMAALARRVLRPVPAAFLVGLVAFSNGYVWLGCNVKPYILDAFLAAGILYVFVRTEHWSPVRRILAFTLAAPLLLCTSYPLLFLYAGLMLAFLPVVWQQRQASLWGAYVSLGLVVVVTFGCLYFGPIRAQRVPGLVGGWMNKFPDITRPASVPGWVVGNSFLVFHYCYNPIGSVCALFIPVGVWWCWRNRRLDLACITLGPLAVCLLAAFKHAYPFSGNRLMLFAAPGIGLMTGLGVSAALDSWSRRANWAIAGLVAVLILPEVGLTLYRLHTPWSQPDSVGSANYVKEHRLPGDLIATKGGTFGYYFFGEILSLEEAAAAPARQGQRVWIPMDYAAYHGDPRATVLSVFPPEQWELQSETLFPRVSVFLVICRSPGKPDAHQVSHAKAEQIDLP